MIRYALICDGGHEFEAWFASSGAYDAQAKRRQVVCPQCGSHEVAKGVMAPNIAPASQKKKPAETREKDDAPDLPAMIRKFREYVETTSDYVGDRFADEARKIHHREADARGIYGSATAEEARQLHEEGVEFHPLPMLPEEHN